MRLVSDEARALFGDRLDALPYRERMFGPSWLTGELVAGDGRRKLEEWLERTPPPWPLADREELLQRIQGFGDFLPACALVADVLAAIAPPVAEYCVAKCTFVGAGLRTLGWCGSAPDTAGRPWYIFVSGAYGTLDSVRAVVAHEVAHSWTLPEPKPGSAPWLAGPTAAYRDMTPQQALELRPDAIQPFLEAKAADKTKEKLAEALARSWGYRNPWEYKS